jgi:hypothetical protein
LAIANAREWLVFSSWGNSFTSRGYAIMANSLVTATVKKGQTAVVLSFTKRNGQEQSVTTRNHSGFMGMKGDSS